MAKGSSRPRISEAMGRRHDYRTRWHRLSESDLRLRIAGNLRQLHLQYSKPDTDDPWESREWMDSYLKAYMKQIYPLIRRFYEKQSVDQEDDRASYHETADCF